MNWLGYTICWFYAWYVWSSGSSPWASGTGSNEVHCWEHEYCQGSPVSNTPYRTASTVLMLVTPRGLGPHQRNLEIKYECRVRKPKHLGGILSVSVLCCLLWFYQLFSCVIILVSGLGLVGLISTSAKMCLVLVRHSVLLTGFIYRSMNTQNCTIQ